MSEQESQRDRWDHVKGRIMGIWGNISDAELERTRGNISSISHLILKKYGETKQTVASRLVDVMHAIEGDEEKDNDIQRELT